MKGADFLERYGGTTDPVTRVEPGRTYTVRVAAAHAVYEHFRVRTFAELLGGAVTSEGRRLLLGELMYQSHASYSACGLGSEGTDRLVELVKEAGPARGLHGAKITGGGAAAPSLYSAGAGRTGRLQRSPAATPKRRGTSLTSSAAPRPARRRSGTSGSGRFK